ncbi:hypothetical protein NPJ88_000010 [Halomonas elongata]|uniref:hypothetical protein n=1 Tax=Halomonas elongata TaxID=2746 RepID=UPI00255AD82C|nr:hypothetical protein [Halomonas elongata]MDL4860705.1 hypothetical protein [Halomonas elongata]
MKTVTASLKAIPARIQTEATLKVWGYLDNCSPASRAAFFAGATMVTGAQSAVAQSSGGGFGGMSSTAAEQGSTIADNASTIFVAAGFIIAGFGGMNLYKRSRETRDGGTPETPMMKIIGPFVAGAVLASTGAVMILGGETIGIDQSDYGTIPG